MRSLTGGNVRESSVGISESQTCCLLCVLTKHFYDCGSDTGKYRADREYNCNTGFILLLTL